MSGLGKPNDPATCPHGMYLQVSYGDAHGPGPSHCTGCGQPTAIHEPAKERAVREMDPIPVCGSEDGWIGVGGKWRPTEALTVADAMTLLDDYADGRASFASWEEAFEQITLIRDAIRPSAAAVVGAPATYGSNARGPATFDVAATPRLLGALAAWASDARVDSGVMLDVEVELLSAWCDARATADFEKRFGRFATPPGSPGYEALQDLLRRNVGPVK